MDFDRIINGMIRAARLDRNFYATVEKDTSYTQDALVVVILVSLVGALGGFLGMLFAGQVVRAFGSFIFQAVWGVAAFFLWVFLVQLVGTRLFKGIGDFGEVQRCLGFAYAPQILNIFSFIPCLGPLVGLIAWVWSLVAGFVAIRQSLDQDNTNAALTMIVSGIIVIVAWAIIGAIMAAIGIAGAALGGAFSR
jgi:hypothetical protein